jgi:hypothetical protein
MHPKRLERSWDAHLQGTKAQPERYYVGWEDRLLASWAASGAPRVAVVPDDGISDLEK